MALEIVVLTTTVKKNFLGGKDPARATANTSVPERSKCEGEKEKEA